MRYHILSFWEVTLSALLAVTIGNREVGGEGPEKHYLLYQELSA